MRNNHNNHNNQTRGFENWSTEALQARKRELEAWLLKKFPMPPTETDQDAHIERVLQQHKHLFKSASPTAAAAPPADDAQPVDGNELLQEVTQFIARYLQCSEHQRTLFALWVLHTYCFCAARVTPYLAIRSADKQSGKTLCLQLLSLLCDHSALTSGGFTARDLAVPMKEKTIDALLFDECQLTIGTRARPRSPALRAVLAGSFHLGLGHRNIAQERNAFLPKAFASRGPLPEELADRCIPIILEPLGEAHQSQIKNQESKIPVERFDLRLVGEESARLRGRLERWTKNHFNQLTNRTLLPRSAFPPNLSTRQQDLCDPLLQIAALVGGAWIAHALSACAIVFDLQSIFELRPNLQLLADVRDCFAHHNWPDRLPTEALLDWTDSLPARPWDADGPLNPRTIAHLLRPFHIHPRELRTEGNKFRRGYELKALQEPWQKYFPHSTIVNKDAPCDTISAVDEVRRRPAVADNTVSHAGKISALVQPELPKGTKLKDPDKPVVAPTAGTRSPEPNPSKPAKSAAGANAVKGSPQPPSRGSEANQQTQRFSQKPRAKSQELVFPDTKKSAASTDEPKAPAQQSRPDEILPGITCGDVFDDRWLRAFRR